MSENSERRLFIAVILGMLIGAAAYQQTGCAHLERDQDSEYDAGPPIDPPGSPTDGGVEEYPDADVPPDAPPPDDVCEPECDCDDDCDPDGSERCLWGKCYERCGCDDDCDSGYSCRWGVCKKNHH